jgi:hypothetical protein
MVFINGIRAPFIQVTNPNIKNKPAIIIIGIVKFVFLIAEEVVFVILKFFEIKSL